MEKRKRMDEYKLPLEVIVDCLWECCDSSSEDRKDKDTHIPNGAEWLC